MKKELEDLAEVAPTGSNTTSRAEGTKEEVGVIETRP